MSLSAAALRKMRDLGLSADQMIELAEVLEAPRPASAGAERTRRWRERKAEPGAVSEVASQGASHITSHVASQASPRDVTGGTSLPPALDKETSPTPPKEIKPSPPALAEARANRSTQTLAEARANPPKALADAREPAAAGARSPQDRSKPDLKWVAEAIWALQPVLGGKRRATRPDVARALAAAVRRGGDPADVLACCRAYYALPDCTKEGGRFARGAADLIAADRWAEYRPAPGLGLGPADAAAWSGPQAVLEAVRAETDEGFVRSYLLSAEWVPPAPDAADGVLGAIRPRTAYAFDKLSRLQRLPSFARLLQPSPRSCAA